MLFHYWHPLCKANQYTTPWLNPLQQNCRIQTLPFIHTEPKTVHLPFKKYLAPLDDLTALLFYIHYFIQSDLQYCRTFIHWVVSNMQSESQLVGSSCGCLLRETSTLLGRPGYRTSILLVARQRFYLLLGHCLHCHVDVKGAN